MQNLMQIGGSGRSLILNVTATQCTCSLSGTRGVEASDLREFAEVSVYDGSFLWRPQCPGNLTPPCTLSSETSLYPNNAQTATSTYKRGNLATGLSTRHTTRLTFALQAVAGGGPHDVWQVPLSALGDLSRKEFGGGGECRQLRLWKEC
ncbi:hypothetical protein HJG60_012293 [Phyllostomus discolor]|uniref:Uncharacterized protein n=1 Tax=Phyllostomus discolor TaxID=89673 RepID=A0A833ZBI7_9CHIR|nr:hypothetical protein HJG60_012293 [Phyllostomus discolor]